MSKVKKEAKKERKKESRVGIGIDELAVFCKRKGFVYPSAEIYGGLGGFWEVERQ